MEKKYKEIANLSVDDFKKQYLKSEEGLTQLQINENLKKFGKNILGKSKPKPWYKYLLETLINPFNLILIGIIFVLFFTDVIFADKPNYTGIIVIFSIVFISIMLEFISEYRSNKAAEKLKQMISNTAYVIRNGKEVSINTEDVAVGDIVVLSAGAMIPADLRLISSKDLFIMQSSLTGESDSVHKHVENREKDSNEITEYDNICFVGTNVVSGVAKGVVIYTGDDTYFGSISDELIKGKPKTSFEKGTENISKLLIRFMLIMIPIVFFISFAKHGLLQSFLFAVAIAIGITPELLPVILSTSLAKGALEMSKKKTIIKKLDSIQNFGAMDILCTDKTGTLTEDRIVLEKYLNINGEEDKRILKHVFLNSYFQTGLGNNIDSAIIDRGKKSELIEMAKNYEKVSEIPYDFTRRRLSIVVKDKEGKRQLITKGAVEEMLEISSYVDLDGVVSDITDEKKKHILDVTRELNEEGLRVVAVAQKNNIEYKQDFVTADEKEMVLMGFIGFLDPPKESAKVAIKALNENGVRVIVLTGDNEVITRTICNKVNINTEDIILGSEIANLSDDELKKLCEKVNVFAKLSPKEKSRIVDIFKQSGHVVGYMGDGINDSASLHQADVGISVDSAVDIAKESADIILLEKDLMVLKDGIKEGRKTFGNLLKYIKMGLSFNFGEMMSVIIASIALPFLPITPIQLLVQSLIYDIGQTALPFDNADEYYLSKPRKWDVKSLKKFMIYMGPVSSIFDLMVFAFLWFGFGLRIEQAALFQTIWFSYGVVSNLVGLHVVRTALKPFVRSNASITVYVFSILISIVACVIPFTILGATIGLVAIPRIYFLVIIGVPILYCFFAQYMKNRYIRRYGEWI